MSYDSASHLLALDARLAGHRQLLLRMLARLSSLGAGPLAALTTRDPADPAMALLDAWAVVGDLVGFYQERIAAESYLRSASERRSLLELVRALGYELRPGLAASVGLAFTVEAVPGMAPDIVIGAGVRVQSVPGPGQSPQIFETTQPIVAHPAWNRLAPYLPEVELPPEVSPTSLRVRGAGAQLRAGDIVLLEAGADLPEARRLVTVEPDPGGAFTTLRWAEPLAAAITMPPRPLALRWRGGLLGRAAPAWATTPLEQRPPTARLCSAMIGPDLAWAFAAGRLPPNPASGIAAMRLGGALNLFLATAGGGVFRSSDGGASWDTCNAGLRELTLFAIAADPDGRIWAGGADGAIYRSADGGASWAQVSAGSVVETRISYSVDDFEVNKEGKPALIDGKGPKTTTAVLGDGLPRAPVRALLCLPKSVLAATDAGVFQSDDDGRTWHSVSTATDVAAIGLGVDSSTLFARPKGLYLPSSDSPLTNSPTGARALAYHAETIYAAIGDQLAWSQITSKAWASPDTLAAGGGIGALVISGQQIFAVAQTPALNDWPGMGLGPDLTALDLDRREDGLAGERWAVLVDHGSAGPAAVVVALGQARAESVSDFGTADVVTRLELKGKLPAAIIGASRRTLEVVSRAEELPLYTERRAILGPIDLAATPAADMIGRLQLVIAGAAPPLEPGRSLIVIGTYVDDAGEARQGGDEVRVLICAAIPGGLRVILERPGLSRPYLRESLYVYANVAPATHGEQVEDEVLGSGDGSLANQRFTLKYAPLTFVSVPTASGARSTLEVRVNQVLWREVPNLYNLGPRDRCYITRRDDAGRTALIFGDGVRGARLPSGSENIRASYRYGMGLVGLVGAESLTLLLSRPLGVQEVTNPLPATGADDSEGLERARVAAPTALQTLERIVSLADFERFARSFAGIAMAQADLVSTPAGAVIHLTVAGSGGITIATDSPLLAALRAAIDARRNANQALEIAPYRPQPFALSALLYHDPRYPPGVAEAARAALLAAFGFGSRAFGESVTTAQIVGVLQRVPGVVAATIQALTVDLAQKSPQPPALLQAERASWSAGAIIAAELLVIDAQQLTLTEDVAQ